MRQTFLVHGPHSQAMSIASASTGAVHKTQERCLMFSLVFPFGSKTKYWGQKSLVWA